MRRSLRVRLILALVAVCAVEAVLVGAAVRAGTARAFEDFLVEESYDGMVEHVEAWVRETGSIDGFVPPERRARAGDADAGAERPPVGERPPGRGAEPGLPPPVGGDTPIRFGLADLDGRLLLPYAGRRRGDVLPAAFLATGRAIVVDGREVAVGFVPDDPIPILSSVREGSPEDRFLGATAARLAWALVGSLALALAVGVWLSGRLTRPLQALTAAARRVARGDLDTAVEVATDDEVGRLAEAFNTMSARLAEATALRQRMTADLSHDLRTPLTTILGTLEAVRDGALPATPERLAMAYDEAARLGRLVHDLHTLALADAHELRIEVASVDVADVTCQVANLFEQPAQQAGVAVAVEAEPAVAQVDRDRLVQALGNLMDNAIRHTPAGGRVTLSARPARTHVEIVVADTGEGIPADVLPVVFERSVQADAARAAGSAGLGLSIVRSLVNAMGGTVGAASAAGEGTTVTIRLPHGRRAEA